MKLTDFRTPDEALMPVVEAVEAAIGGDLFIKDGERQKTEGHPEMEIVFEGEILTYLRVTIETDHVELAAGWYSENAGSFESEKVPADVDLKDGIRWLVSQLEEFCYVSVCRGCGREIWNDTGYCGSCDDALREDAADAERERRREEGF